MQLYSLLEADMRPVTGSSRGRNSQSKKTQEWSDRTDLVTYDVFKRTYWPHLPRSSTKGVCTSFTFVSLLALTLATKRHLSHSASFLVWLARNFVSSASKTFTGTIKGSEKSLDYPDRALDRQVYENLRSTHKVDYSLFVGYQNLKFKRGERDLADR